MGIIKSLLDQDYYKFTMGQFIFHRYRGTQVEYAFKNRTTGMSVASVVSEQLLRAELESLRRLRFSHDELAFLAKQENGGRRVFQDDYLDFLAHLRFGDFSIAVVNGEFDIRFHGPWETRIYWETPTLAIVSELFYNELYRTLTGQQKRDLYAEGIARHSAKMDTLYGCPQALIAEFGTRRRRSRAWQEGVFRDSLRRIPKQILGTSNVYLAKKYGVRPIGTFAHELTMATGALAFPDLAGAQVHLLDEWWDEYGAPFSIALSDTYGSEFFFRHLTEQQVRDWRGFRQDSGDPFDFARSAITLYEAHDIIPVTKLCLFSDGLIADRIVRLTNSFFGKIGTGFGWGTNLTNDLGFNPLSLVIKLVRVNGKGTVKLTDNLAKAIGAPDEIESYKAICGYTNSSNEKCVY